MSTNKSNVFEVTRQQVFEWLGGYGDGRLLDEEGEFACSSTGDFLVVGLRTGDSEPFVRVCMLDESFAQAFVSMCATLDKEMGTVGKYQYEIWHLVDEPDWIIPRVLGCDLLASDLGGNLLYAVRLTGGFEVSMLVNRPCRIVEAVSDWQGAQPQTLAQCEDFDWDAIYSDGDYFPGAPYVAGLDALFLI